MKVKELLTDASKWARNYLAFDERNVAVEPEAPNARSFCLLGAVYRCYGRGLAAYDITETISHYLLNTRGYMPSGHIAVYNDNVASFEDIKKLVNELDI